MSDRKYSQDVISAFQNGCGLDLRVRLATQFLCSPMFTGAAVGEDAIPSKVIAGRALAIATELVDLAHDRGLIEPIMPDTGLDQLTREHFARVGAAQVHQQLGANKEAQANQGRVAVPMQGPMGGRPN